MIKFHNAINENGKIINISDVTQENRAKHYTCVGCGKEMSAVLGQVKEHHFRHKGDSCSWESYLHSLGKKLIKEKFDNQKEFLIKLPCNNSKQCRLKQLKPDIQCETHDLKRIYDTCEEEKTYNGFRADLMLSNSKNKEHEPFFIEISVSHDCEDNKISSGTHIMEIKIADENSLYQITKLKTISHDLCYNQQPIIRFYNLEASIPLDRFWITKDEDGVLRGFMQPNALLCKDVYKYHRSDSIYEIAIPSLYGITMDYEKINTYSFCILKAIDSRINIKHCNLCQNQSMMCKIPYNTKYFNKETGKEEAGTRMLHISQIPEQYLDKFKIASTCKRYYRYSIRLQISNIPYIEWFKQP